MGNKIITEKDFWMCSCGAVPAQLQSQQKTAKKKTGEKFITVMDKSTSSWIDFGCTRLMLIYAIIAAAVVVIAAMTVATGGAALIALGALAGLAGAAWGAIVGSLLCGQLAAKARTWVGSKNDYIVQKVHTITGDNKMTCPVGGTITFAPQIKNWSQAIALGAGNYIGHLMEGMMAGAAIGMGGAALSGGASAFASGGMRGLGQAAFQFAKSAPLNVIKNIGATFGYSGGFSATSIGTALGLRGLTSAQAGLQHYGSTGESGWGAAGEGAFGMEKGMAESGKNIATGNAGWQDVTGLALLLSPVHKATEEAKVKTEEPIKDGETGKDGEQKKADEETVKDTNTAPDETVKKEGDGEAYEATVLRMRQINGDPPFTRNAAHDLVEFQRQIEGQEAGMNKLTVAEFLANRDAYLENGRSLEGSRAQENYRAQFLQDRIETNIENGMLRDEARAEAETYMSDKAALHDPDQVAGGHGENVTGLGDSKINSSLGSQWAKKGRIDAIHTQIREQAASMTPEEQANTYLNINLPWN